MVSGRDLEALPEREGNAKDFQRRLHQVFQRRGDYKQPKDYFFKDWEQYSLGFGKLNEDFWLGNDKLFALTNQANYSLRIDMKDLEGNKRYAFYKEFWIENERQQYKLHVSGFEGDAGKNFYYNKMK
ncbi:techylectin-5A-like [Centruroides sculpturatus]|uniref:techylectin-5A-like n=1 Tax=Centruroides sculpturatus TaxID=218467 RepID=UPI000C6D844B|nr:techylectin-5A-like [Centruroides sculpturatus]